MIERLHNPPEHIEPVYRWYKRAQVDYVEQYIKLYIAYNAWYREVTGTTNDRLALSKLKKRSVIWDDYTNGKTLNSLKLYAQRLAELTQREPLGKTMHWSGCLDNAYDWHSIIEFWYQIRCLLVHGENVKPRYVWLAYETLDAFMGEILERMQKVLADTPPRASSESQKNLSLQQKLYAKYVASPDIWQVDMRPV